METFKIKAILAAVKYKSLSRAAEEFSYTPSAFSHMTTALEDELGIKLFTRSSTGVELTDEGRELYPYLCALVKSEEVLTGKVREILRGRSYELHIGTYSSISRNLLSRLLKRLTEEYPNIKLSVSVSDKLEGWLDDGHADIVFADNTSFGNNEWFPIMKDRYLAVVPADFAKGRDSITVDELYRYPHIFTDDAFLTPYIDKTKFRDLVCFRSEDDLSLIHMVKAGMGIALLPELSLREHFDGIAALPLTPEIPRIIGFAYKKQRIRDLGLTKFIKSLSM